MIQPTLTCDWAWPLNLICEIQTGNLGGSGNHSFNLYPGKEVHPLSYPNEMRHHAVYRWMTVDLGASLAVNVGIFDVVNSVQIDEFYNATATDHFPLAGILPDRRHLQWPYYMRVQVVGVAGQSYRLNVVRFDLEESDPIPNP